MYRRKKQVEKKEEPKPQKKPEPVVSKVVIPAKKLGDEYGNVPMINVLRKIEYLNDVSEGSHSVPFEKMIDIAFSKGYLNVDDTAWYIGSGLTWGSVYQPANPSADPAEEEQAGAFTDTTDYKRDTFMCGDVIFTKDDKIESPKSSSSSFPPTGGVYFNKD